MRTLEKQKSPCYHISECHMPYLTGLFVLTFLVKDATSGKQGPEQIKVIRNRMQ